MGKLKQSSLLFTTPGRATKEHSKNKSILWRNRGQKTLDLFTWIFFHKLSEISSYSFIYGLCSDTYNLIQLLKVIFQKLLQTDLTVFSVATLNCFSLLYKDVFLMQHQIYRLLSTSLTVSHQSCMLKEFLSSEKHMNCKALLACRRW